MTYDPRDTDPLTVWESDSPYSVRPVRRDPGRDEYDWDGWLEDYKRKPGVPRPVLYYGIGALIVIVAVLVIAGWVR